MIRKSWKKENLETFEAAMFNVKIFISPWKLAGNSVAMLPKHIEFHNYWLIIILIPRFGSHTTWWRKNQDMQLTHWGRDRMADILQTTLSNAFSPIKIGVFWLNFNFTAGGSLGSHYQEVLIGSSNGLSPVQCQAITWTNDDLNLSCYMVSLGHMI